MKSGKRAWTILQLGTVLILTFGTAGWVLPGHMALGQFLSGIESIVTGDPAEGSAIRLEEARRLFWLTAVWLFSVLFVWGFLGARRMLLPTRRERDRA